MALNPFTFIAEVCKLKAAKQLQNASYLKSPTNQADAVRIHIPYANNANFSLKILSFR